MSLTENKQVKQLEEYKTAMKKLLIKDDKSLDYVMGYVTCLHDTKLLSIQDSLELMKYISSVYFKKRGWEK